MPRTVSPFLMFHGVAEQAMTLYAQVFSDARITQLDRFGPGEPGPEGSVKRGALTLGGREWLCFDSPVTHAFTFTPSFSIFVECESEAELDRTFARLSEGGLVRMPLGSYGFSAKFGWTDDRFGVSWQLNLT